MTLLVAFVSFCIGLSTFAMHRPPLMDFTAAVVEFDLLEPEDVDEEATLWIDAALRQGEAGDGGRKLLAAFGWVRAQYQGRHSPLRRSVVASIGTGRRAPGAIRLPLTEDMVKMLAVTLAAMGRAAGWGADPGIAVMVGFHLYLRPGELLRLRWGHFHSAVVAGKTVVGALLHPREANQPSKTGAFDECTLIDLEPLAKIIMMERRRRHPSTHVVLCPPSEFQKLWR